MVIKLAMQVVAETVAYVLSGAFRALVSAVIVVISVWVDGVDIFEIS